MYAMKDGWSSIWCDGCVLCW